MLSQIESKLTALVSDRLTGRIHLTVLQAPGPVPALDPGRGVALVSLGEVTPSTCFAPAQSARTGLQSRRVLPVEFFARVDLSLRPEGPVSRGRLLDDVSLVCHALADESFATGAAFAVADPDPGFQVSALVLDGVAIGRDPEPQNLTATLRYQGKGLIWPPGVSQPEGEIRAVDTVMVPLPLELTGAVAHAGESRTIRVRSPAGQRLAQIAPRQSQPLRLAVTVLSDAPPADRGSIAGGVAGTETGFRVLAVALPETAITYQAPATVSRGRIEYVAIHLATPTGARGVFLGSAAVRLEP